MRTHGLTALFRYNYVTLATCTPACTRCARSQSGRHGPKTLQRSLCAAAVSRLRQVSQIEASGSGSSGRALFDDVVAGITLQQLQVRSIMRRKRVQELPPRLLQVPSVLSWQRGWRRDGRRPCDSRAVVVDQPLIHSSSSSPSNGSIGACATADGQSFTAHTQHNTVTLSPSIASVRFRDSFAWWRRN